ncbi:uncharacterized protein C20orf85-like [Brienomyrus brachyistius]|uniref:uncharacterized protein C20orf85-like n=1 Tax=Brienomyrus brachyistius TaxID=42636 RepID=UPI0020B2C72F|nr:uncharacterized protein C20orf85-like [Brienomyrus brachyistius]
MATEKARGKPCNFVDQDQIWRVHVNIELESAKAWPSKWGFLKESYSEVLTEGNRVREEMEKLELPQHLRTNLPTPPETYIKVMPSSPVPRTTQALIGWRSAVPEMQLDHFGQVNRCKKSFLKELGWSIDSCR